MQSKAHITFRGFPHSDAVESSVQKNIDKLETFYPRITSCNVVLESAHHHHHKGNLYCVHICVSVPNKNIVVSHDSQQNHAHEDVYVAIRDAFKAARRQLEDYARVQRGEVKKHAKSGQANL